MKGPSLRLTLLGWAVPGLALALLASGVAIAFIFAAHVERAALRDLTGQFTRLASLIDMDDVPPVPADVLADPRFKIPQSGLYWQINDENKGTVFRSRSLWDSELSLDPALLEGGATHILELAGPNNQALLATARHLTYSVLGGEVTVIVTVAMDRAGLASAVADFSRDLALALLVLGAALVLAAWAQVTLGLRPLEALRRGVAAIRSGAKNKLEGPLPAEVAPLAAEVNDLLTAQENSIQFARARAADLAHGLKSNLTALGAEAARLDDKGDHVAGKAISELATDMNTRIDYQLRLSRLRIRTRNERQATDLATSVRQVVDIVRRAPNGDAITWNFDLPESAVVNIDRHDCLELIGVLVENAAEWARSAIDIWCAQVGETFVLRIDDDGPGIPTANIGELGLRGNRLDESRGGAGLGLAIAHEIAAHNGGRLEFSQSVAGGLSVSLTLPV